MKSTALNASVLKEIAKESGGEYFSIDNLEQLAGLVYASRNESSNRLRRSRFGVCLRSDAAFC